MRAPKGTKASAFLHESEVSWKMNNFPIHRWKTLVGGKSGPEDILFGTWELAPHAGHHSQKHDAPEIYYVISGKALWTVGDETQVVTKGMAIYTKSGAVHEMVNLTDEPVQAIWIWWAPEGDREVFNGEYVFTEEAHTQPENQRSFAAILVDPMAWHSIRKNVCSCAKCWKSGLSVKSTMPENRISNQQKRHRSSPFITDLAGINGVMLSKDETVLYVIEYRNRKIHAFGWNDQAGTVGKGKLFSEIQTEGTEHGADGMAIDDQNRLYVCCLGGIWVFNRTGQQANFISLPEEKVTNCAFAGEDYNTLYITTQKSLFLAKR